MANYFLHCGGQGGWILDLSEPPFVMWCLLLCDLWLQHCVVILVELGPASFCYDTASKFWSCDGHLPLAPDPADTFPVPLLAATQPLPSTNNILPGFVIKTKTCHHWRNAIRLFGPLPVSSLACTIFCEQCKMSRCWMLTNPEDPCQAPSQDVAEGDKVGQAVSNDFGRKILNLKDICQW